MDKELEEAAERFYPPTTTDLICSPKLVRDEDYPCCWSFYSEKMLVSKLLLEGCYISGIILSK